MITTLVDHNIEGHAALLWDTLTEEGWLEIFSLRFVKFDQVGLSHNSNDREVWRFAQKYKMIMITANRRMRGKDNLEQVIREENTEQSLPVFTIGNVRRIFEKAYRDQCIARLLEIIEEMDNYLGTGRILSLDCVTFAIKPLF